MHHRLLELIHCPTGHSDLELSAAEQEGDEITSGTLDCRGCERKWPILRGIPRFIEGISDEADLRKVYADSFGHQWTTYDWLRDEDEEEFFTITDLSPEDLSGKTVFDAGCGGGRLARIVAPRCRECVGRAPGCCRTNAWCRECGAARRGCRPGRRSPALAGDY